MWRRWDLHVHTPKSLVQHYGGDTDTAWTRFFAELEALPSDFRVVGINDYLFIDGYERVIQAKQQGRLTNLDLILPVIELRLDKFGGVDGQLSRLNYHIIFSDLVTPAEIREQFLGQLKADYMLDVPFQKVINRTTLAELGEEIIKTTPVDKRHGSADPLTVGFNNLSFHLADVEKLLTNTTFTNRFVTAVGKTEWANIKWQQSAAEKRSIINRADFVFVAANSPEQALKSRIALHAEEVNGRVLDCSDAHYFSDSTEKERIGNCFTWIKADPTFDGLLQVRYAPDERIYIGDVPEKVRLVRDRATKFLRQVEIRPAPTKDLQEKWFDNLVPLNPDLVAIIGNKGMGKSALTDVIALTGNADAPSAKYGFLADSKFRDRKDNKARHFIATVEWESGEQTSRLLAEDVPAGTVPLVRYIPQNYFEDLCNETADATLLQRELRGVIFSNLTSAQRGRYTNLDELIATQTRETERRIDELRGELRTVNREIVQIERELSENRQKELQDALHQQSAALTAHDQNKPAEVEPPAHEASSPAVDAARVQLETLTTKENTARADLRNLYDLRSTAEILQGRFASLRDAAAKLRATTASDLARVGLAFEQIIPADVDLAPLTDRLDELSEAIATTEATVDGPEGYASRRTKLHADIITLQEELGAPARAFQQYLDRLATWEQQRSALVGTAQAAGTIENLKARLTTIRNEHQERLHSLSSERATLVREIHSLQLGITEFQRTLYAPVAARLASHGVVRAQLAVNFAAKLVDLGLEDKFIRRINRNRKGAFAEEHAFRDHVVAYDFNVTEEVVRFVTETASLLHHNQHGEPGDIDEIRRQLRQSTSDHPVEDLYNFLFGLEYLSPRYALRINDRELPQLTPGERGSLLLVFYLVIDQDDRPLIIEQPEENLDNQSVYELLVPCIREAKARRQIIIVTHNPNLAVVCNAEQIIWCRIAKDIDHQVTYTSGSIENREINRHLVDVLKGTWPAFTDRGRKYRGSS